MSSRFDSLAQDALALDPGERLRLASQLIDSVEGPADPTWCAAWSAELDRRAAKADQQAVRGRTWEEVHADLSRRLTER